MSKFVLDYEEPKEIPVVLRLVREADGIIRLVAGDGMWDQINIISIYPNGTFYRHRNFRTLTSKGFKLAPDNGIKEMSLDWKELWYD